MEEVAVVRLHRVVLGSLGQPDHYRANSPKNENSNRVKYEVGQDVLVGQSEGLEYVSRELVVEVR